MWEQGTVQLPSCLMWVLTLLVPTHFLQGYQNLQVSIARWTCYAFNCLKLKKDTFLSFQLGGVPLVQLIQSHGCSPLSGGPRISLAHLLCVWSSIE